MNIEKINLQSRMRLNDEEHVDYLRNNSNYSNSIFLDNRESVRSIRGSLAGWFIPYIVIAPDSQFYHRAVFIDDKTVFDWVVKTRQL